jgi:FkbM family methyltransferase
MLEALDVRVDRASSVRRLIQDAESLAKITELYHSVRPLRGGEARACRRFLNLCMRHHRSSTAQYFQDLFVVDTLHGKRGGYFVEVGAADGRHFSNTYLLERRFGWTGIAVDPARRWRRSLRANRRCAVDFRCVWSGSGERVLFNETDHAQLSTVDAFSGGDMHAVARQSGRKYLVDTVSLNDLLLEYNAPRRIDYLSIDSEGSELTILEAFSLAEYQVGVITVEHNFSANREPIQALLQEHGFRRVLPAVSACDDWYVHAKA